jgi:hypothetical protein
MNEEEHKRRAKAKDFFILNGSKVYYTRKKRELYHSK